MPRSRVSSDMQRKVQLLTDVSSAEYAQSQVVKALGNLKKFSSDDEIAAEANVSAQRSRVAIGWLAFNGLLEKSPPGTGKLWRLSAEGLVLLKGIIAAERFERG
jgi:hypothetical protein